MTMTRPFNAQNEQLPACVRELAQLPPLCFDKPIWVLWLQSSWSSVLNDPVARKAMERGRAPDYCSECTKGYQAKRMAEGRCAPPLSSPAAELVYRCVESANG
jgi:hypothetical protein